MEEVIFWYALLEDMAKEIRKGFRVWGFDGCVVEGN